ncbi:MAG: glycosyltransferase family 4 protein [Planctomycetota bacterium]
MPSTPQPAASQPPSDIPQSSPPASPIGPGRQPRVLHVINGEHYAGAERVQDLLALRLPDLGFYVGFVALKAGRFGDVRQSRRTRLVEADMLGRWDLRAVAKVVDEYRRGGYHLLHAHTPRSAMVAALAARWTGAPLVYHVHSPTARDSTRRWQNWLNDRVERLSMSRATKMITVSPTLNDYLRELEVDSKRIACVPNGVPAFAGVQPRTTPAGGWTIGMVALFRPRKGAEALLEAFAQLRRHGADARLRMIGPFETSDYEEHLLRLARKLEVADAVDWRGFREDVADELRGVDVLALPSLFGEGLPMVILEAMAAAVPVVGTRCEGVSQAVVDGETGVLVEPGDPDGLASSLAKVLTGELCYESLSKQALSRHAERFSDTAMARGVAHVYREVLDLPAEEAAALKPSEDTSAARAG